MMSGKFHYSALLGIEHVSVGEYTEVARVDVITRSSAHASALEERFQVRPFRFPHAGGTLHSFARLPAASAKKWLAEQGLAFTVSSGALRPGGPMTWVQGGFAS